MSKPKITEAQFEREYAERSGMTVERLRALGSVVRPCACGEKGCEGWQSVSHETAEWLDENLPPAPEIPPVGSVTLGSSKPSVDDQS